MREKTVNRGEDEEVYAMVATIAINWLCQYHCHHDGGPVSPASLLNIIELNTTKTKKWEGSKKIVFKFGIYFFIFLVRGNKTRISHRLLAAAVANTLLFKCVSKQHESRRCLTLAHFQRWWRRWLVVVKYLKLIPNGVEWKKTKK